MAGSVVRTIRLVRRSSGHEERPPLDGTEDVSPAESPSPRVAAVVAVVRSFCEEVLAYYRARKEGEIWDAEARVIAEIVGRFVEDLETLAGEVCRREKP